MTEYQDINAATIDRWVEEGWEWGRPLSHESFERAKRGDWDVLLTPTKAVPHAWFGELKGKRILGLASGGGQQIPVFAALGAVCTVLDYSPRQLESERAVAAREGYDVEIVRADMAKPLPFPDGSFDLIFHPVSNCYVREVRPIWRECARVLRPGGRLLAGLDNGMNFIVGDGEREIVNRLPFDPLKNPDQMELLRRVDGGVQFSHTLDEQIGGQLEAGFTLLALYEDTNGSGRLHELGIPSFLAIGQSLRRFCLLRPRGACLYRLWVRIRTVPRRRARERRGRRDRRRRSARQGRRGCPRSARPSPYRSPRPPSWP